MALRPPFAAFAAVFVAHDIAVGQLAGVVGDFDLESPFLEPVELHCAEFSGVAVAESRDIARDI